MIARVAIFLLESKDRPSFRYNVLERPDVLGTCLLENFGAEETFMQMHHDRHTLED